MSQSYDLKYRPKKFSDVIGNSNVVKLLLTRSKSGTLTKQSMMFGGPKGCGKTSLARLVARAIVCTNIIDGEPCNECNECISVLNETSDSVTEFDAASHGSVDKIRDIVNDTDYVTSSGSKHVYIIDEAQRLTSQAQDAFLKAIEDRSLIVILCTTEPHKIKPPIRSRVEEYPVFYPKRDDMISWIKTICKNESIDILDESLDVITKMNECCPRSCVLSLERLNAIGDTSVDSVRKLFRFNSYELVDKVLYNIDSNPKEAFKYLDELVSSESPTWIRDAMVFAVASGVRIDSGAKSNYPTPIRFYQTRLKSWVNFANALSMIDKPNIHDIESSLFLNEHRVVDSYKHSNTLGHIDSFSDKKSDTKALDVKAVESKDLKEICEVKQEVVVKEKDLNKQKSNIEIDGVVFSTHERLTTLDDKVMPDAPVKDQVFEFVELNKTNASEYTPITEKEFIKGLIGRLQK